MLSVLNITTPTFSLRLLPTSTPRPNPALVVPFNTQELKTSFRMHSPEDCLILSTPSRVRHTILCLPRTLLPTTVHIGRILAILPLSNYFPRWISLLVLMIYNTSFIPQHVDLNNSFCPTCNSNLRPPIIIQEATRSFSASRVFPFGRRYPLDPLCPQPGDLPLSAIPICTICRWPHLTEGAFRARAFTLLNPLSLRTSREALLRVTFDDLFFERCNRHLVQQFRGFTMD